MKKLLFVGAHIDDEQCAAGMLSKFSSNYEIFLVAFSFCEESSIQLGYPGNVLVDEFNCSMEALRIKKENVFTEHYPVRHFPEHRQEILDKLIILKKEINPNIVIVPSLRDRHQDHAVIAEEGRRAFPYVTVLGFETPKSPLSVKHICYIKLEEVDIERKIVCKDCYRSQKVRGINREQAMSMMAFRGVQAGCEYAEAFEVISLFL